MTKPPKVVHGDCLDIMRMLPDNSADSIVTDPPIRHPNDPEPVQAHQVIPEEAVEAAAERLYSGWRTSPADWQGYFRRKAAEALEAAAPHMRPHGDGENHPGWDDRKALAELWQRFAPLPADGLSERVYEALIEVAAWGYQQRIKEEAE